MESIQHPKIRFYTTCFAGKDINDLKPMLNTFDAVLVDVRFSPTSEAMRWRQIYLKTLLREKYRHIPQPGSRAFREERATIHSLELGIKVLICFSTNAVLLCECADLNACHRLMIAKDLQNKGFDIQELESWKVE
jgi:uncharacterized protein (DUF488 family)